MLSATNSEDFGRTDVVMPSTIISVVPFPIEEHKPGLIPGVFRIAASVNHEPQCLVIGETKHHVWIDQTRGNLVVRNPSYVTARSIVADYLVGQLAARPDAHPGIFWLPGEWSPQKVKKEAGDKLQQTIEIQLNWFHDLVQIADDDWEKYRQHVFISDFQRHAARTLDPQNTRQRPWLIAAIPQASHPEARTVLCPACGSDIPEKVVICRYCSFVLDQERHDKMNFANDLARKAMNAIRPT